MLNSDGSVREGGYGYGGLVRDIEGEAVLCYNGKEGEGSVLEQKLGALHCGIILSLEQQISRLDIGSDSLLAVWIIKRTTKPPWYLRNLVQAIHNTSRGF